MKNNEFFSFILSKHFDWQEINQEMSDRLMEDEFNSTIAEEALDIAFDVYPDGSDIENELMDKRHEFVSDFMEYCRCEYIKECAGNMGMISLKASNEKANLQAAEATKFWKAQVERQAKNFRNMSSYQFSNWKLDYDDVKEYRDDVMDYMPQDSEDEAWEQLMVFQKENFGDV